MLVTARNRGRLVLSRKPGESAVIRMPDGRTIDVTVMTHSDGHRVKLCFLADADVEIDRKEIYDRKHPPEAKGESPS